MRRLTIAALPLLLLTAACEEDEVACTEEFRMITPVVVDSTGALVGDFGGRSILRATGDTLHEIHEGSAGPQGFVVVDDLDFDKLHALGGTVDVTLWRATGDSATGTYVIDAKVCHVYLVSGPDTLTLR
ncbi:MAG: hypothetical protein IPK12_01130 [Gemmatimonadetes bacterium]|nr:hypothetical protein [Gemmatimonadota bacterium]